MLLHQEVTPSDAIFVLGSRNSFVAERAADLWKEGIAPYVIVSGGYGKGKHFERPEADVFADVLLQNGVPSSAIILERHASNTGENIQFTRQLLKEKGLHFSSLVLVQKPYMERRTFATFSKQWPEMPFCVTSPLLSYEEYSLRSENKKGVIETMVGDLLRIREYPKMGFQIEQEIPENVWLAGQELLKRGYDSHALA